MFKADLSAGVSVFLVALPLCLGIALASGAPLLSGLIAGIVGGTVVSIFSGSQVSVSGPAAGLTVIVLNAIHTLGNFQSFLTAVVLSGFFQIGLALLGLGFIADYVPTAVIQGMLCAIGIVIILKQIPHALGSDYDYNGDFSFKSITTDKNSFDEIIFALSSIHTGAISITIVSILILYFWERIPLKNHLRSLPASLVVVILSVLLNQFFEIYQPSLSLSNLGDHLVKVPVSSLGSALHSPDLAQILNLDVLLVAITIAIVASMETLLSIEAADKLDPYRRISNPNKELFAQGLGNALSGLLGGLPVTSVVVRTTANIYSGSKSWLSSFIHGILLLFALLLIPELLNLIPLSCLAAILITLGFKLCRLKIFKEFYALGHVQFIPFIVTVFSVLLSDLLTGVLIGLVVGLFYVLKSSHLSAFTLVEQDNLFLLRFNKEVSFLNKAELKELLQKVPQGASLVIDGVKAIRIDHDIRDVIRDYRNTAAFNNVSLEVRHINIRDQ